jgi:hypothetical protein
MKKQTALSALTMSALAIPNAANGMAVPDKKTLSLRYTQYQEAEMPLERVDIGGSTGRYNIDILQFRYFTPVLEKYSLDTNLSYETMSGASAYGSSLNDSGQTKVHMSGASGGIEESRVDGSVLGTRYFEDGSLGSSFAFSTENDYNSVAVGLSGALEIFQKHTTLLASLSLSYDELSPTDAELFGGGRSEADGETKRSFSFYQGVSQVIDKYSTLQVGFGFTRLSGHLSDPYRTRDDRPELRQQNTLSVQYRYYLNKWGGMAIHGDYRYYQDDWGILANTISTSIWKDVEWAGQHLTLAPNVRYHWQHAADFYSVDSTSTSVFYSDDYRLSAYGALSVGIDLQFHHKDTSFTLGVSQYLSSEDWGLTGSEDTETPTLVDFTTLSLGLDYHF